MRKTIASCAVILLLVTPTVTHAFAFSEFFNYMLAALQSDIFAPAPAQLVINNVAWRMVYAYQGGLGLRASAQFQNDLGETVTMNACLNGGGIQVIRRVCTSTPNSCGQRGTGFETVIDMNTGEIVPGDLKCTAVTPPDSACPPVPPPTTPPTPTPPPPPVTPTGGTPTPPTTCSVSYSCSGANILRRNADCTQTTYATCASYQVCAPGSSACITPDIGVRAFITTDDGVGGVGGATMDGHLSVRPSLVAGGTRTHLYWNVINAASCTVSDGTRTLSTAFTSGTSGVVSDPIFQQTTFRLRCLAHAGATVPGIDETGVVNIIPAFQEQ